MARLSPEEKRRRKEERRQIRSERQIQCFLKFTRNRSEYPHRYSACYYLPNTPEAAIQRWHSDIERAKQILRDYEAKGKAKDTDKK